MAKNVKNKKSSSKKNNVVKYRRKPQAAAIIFAMVLVYIVCFVFIYLSKSKVQVYEVDTGALTSNAVYTGIAVREESVYNSEYSGNINYYKKEGTRVKVGDTIYTVDETGRVSEILSQYNTSGENTLSSSSLATIKSMLNSFRTGYNGNNFSDVYDLKTDINAAVLQAMNESIMENLESIIQSTGSQNLFRTITTDATGVVAYYVDGYEGLKAEDISEKDFDRNNYTKQNLKAEDLIVSSNPAYKLITSEDWQIIIPLTEKDIKEYDLNNKSSVSIKFKKDNITTTAGFSVLSQSGSYYGKITLNKYMIRYSTERFLDIELITSSKTGLKIPVSAITENEFYTIPNEFLTTGGNSNDKGFICESYDTAGNVKTTFEAVSIYKSTDTVCYVEKDELPVGSNIVMPDSSKRYTIGPTEKLKGVYCVNTGYTVFRLVDIIDQNDEYIISKTGISHGIGAYDRILLDASKYSPGQMVY